jgi:hypothetical protein
VGCDDTRGPHAQIRPAVRTIPGQEAAARKAYPWVAFEGRWGELHPAFFNGPTGPNMKQQWTEPVTWSENWRDRSYGIPAGGVLGTAATGSFCGAVETGSNLIRRLANNAGLTLGILAAIGILIAWICSRTDWRPSAPLRLARRRAWGQTVTVTWRMYFSRPLLFIGIGLVTIPISIVVTLLQTGIVTTSSFLGLAPRGEGGGFRAWIVLAIGTVLNAFVLAVRWALIAPCAELESMSGLGALRRSGSLVRREWFKVLSLVVITAGLVLVSGPVLGGLLLLGTKASFAVINIVFGLVYALAMPLVGITTTYVYYEVLAHEHLAELEPPSTSFPLRSPRPDPWACPACLRTWR